jgi:SAM-dependent methyltransferase
MSVGSDSAGSETNNRYTRNAGMAAIIAVAGSAVGLLVISAPFLIVPGISKFGRIPWMTTPRPIVKLAIEKLRVSRAPSQPRPRIIDLGSGDGRVVIAAALEGFDAVGIELNPVLFCFSYFNAFQAGVLRRVSFRMVDFWSVNLADFDAVSCFGVAPVMSRLGEKLAVEAKVGTSVICFRFPLKNKTPKWSKGELYLYEI